MESRHLLRRSGRAPRFAAIAASVVVLSAACQGAQPPDVPAEVPGAAANALDGDALPAMPTGPFSGSAAWRHLEALLAIGPRVYGSAGNEATRDLIASVLTEAGLELETIDASIELRMRGGPPEPVTHALRHLRVRLPGASSDVLAFVAHYDSPQTHRPGGEPLLDANGSGSGTALLLELARVFAARERLYTIDLFFIDGEAGSHTLPPGAGSASLVHHLGETGEIAHIRTAFVFDQVADAELEIARDLRSERTARELIWQRAKKLELGEAFAQDAEFRSPPGPHRAFLARGFRRIVALVDDRYGGSEAPGLYWNSPEDTLEHCSERSLATVGTVVVDAVEAWATRLARIDRFVRSPLAPLDGEPVPEASESPVEVPAPASSMADEGEDAAAFPGDGSAPPGDAVEAPIDPWQAPVGADVSGGDEQ